MALNKLRRLDGNSHGVTLPKDDLLLEGLLDENGQIVDDQHVHVQRVGDGEWKLELVEGLETATT